MITINVKKNVFACLVIAIIFILSLYQYCENNSDKCFYLSVADAPKTSPAANYMQKNTSNQISGHVRWLPVDTTTATPTTIDTLNSLLKKTGRMKQADQKSADDELRRIERVDMEEVEDEEEEREEAKLLGIDKDIDSKSLGYREDGFLKRDRAKETSADELLRNQQRKWLEMRHSQQNLGRYERVDKTILDPGSMTKQELDDFYNKTLNSSSMFMLAVVNGTSIADSRPEAKNNSDKTQGNREIKQIMSKSLAIDNSSLRNSEKTLSNIGNVAGNTSKHANGQGQGFPVKPNGTTVDNTMLHGKATKNMIEEQEILRQNPSKIKNQTSSEGSNEHYSKSSLIEMQNNFNKRSKIDRKRGAVNFRNFTHRHRTEQGKIEGSNRNVQERKIVEINATHDDEDDVDDNDTVDNKAKNPSDVNIDEDDSGASGSTESGRNSDMASRYESAGNDMASGIRNAPIGNEDTELHPIKHNDAAESPAVTSHNADDDNRKAGILGENNADIVKNEVQARDGDNDTENTKDYVNVIEDSVKTDGDIDGLGHDTGSVRNEENSNDDDLDAETSGNQAGTNVETNYSSEAITDELRKTDKFEEEEKYANLMDTGKLLTKDKKQTIITKDRKSNKSTGYLQRHEKGQVPFSLDASDDSEDARTGHAMQNYSQSFLANSSYNRNQGIQKERSKTVKNLQASNDREPHRKKQIEHKGWLIYQEDVSCLPIDPKLVLYNRIFKTGSTSLNEYLKDEGKRNYFQIRIGTTEDWYKTGNSHPYPRNIEKFANRSMRRRVYTGHFFFREKLSIKRTYTYINQVREPLDRILSHFFYMRNSTARPKKRIVEMKAAGEYNETLHDCFTNQHRGCENNVMTHFLCGEAPFCNTGSEKAIQKAKYNMLHYYTAIGLTENLDLYLKILHKRLPKYFRISRTLPREKTSRNKKFMGAVSEELKARIKHANFADYQIYEYAKYLFNRQLKACNITAHS